MFSCSWSEMLMQALKIPHLKDVNLFTFVKFFSSHFCQNRDSFLVMPLTYKYIEFSKEF